ncbi:MAG TPA: glutamate-cysteine ligase family protein, partial [Gemmatimonadales bacterium]|nr:glutamate-cysteine ligase family protein [Gemmatimonadales bacterium]
IPVESATGRRCPIEASGGGPIATLPFLRRHAGRQGWRETRTPKGAICFEVPGGGGVSYEPGGQIEYSSPPHRTASALLADLRGVVLPLRAAAAAEGIDLLTVGIDPCNPVERCPLFLRLDRYERMADYLAARGPAGAMMMRQTAAFQIGIDLDDEPLARWRVLNAAAPCFVAIFANSPLHEGVPTGCHSTRAQAWRALDPLRTGLPWDGERPIESYLEFALAAPALLLPATRGRHLSFGEWLTRARPTLAEWHEHLTTLFPEVRPRGRFELRSADAVPPQWYAAPVALAAGITYDPWARRAATDLLGAPDLGLLERAGRLGLRDPVIGPRAAELAEIALRGCDGLGPGYLHPADLEVARAFFERYTWCGRSPADDIVGGKIAA